VHKRREESAIQRGPSRDIPLAITAGLGVVLTTVLLVLAATQSSLPYCGSGSGCDIVQTSRWSTLLGLPVAAWGWGVYVVVSASAVLISKKSTRWHVAIFFATIGFAVSVYLNAIAVVVIEASCIYCLASLALITVIYLLTWRADGLKDLNGWRIGSTAAAVFVVGLMHLNYAGAFDPAAGPEDPYVRALAEHLSASDAKFYGAYWCPHCQQQKSAFGASAERLPYVECSPNGQRSAPATSCLAVEIRNYPTWIIEGRRLERTLSVRQLARYSGFRPPPVEDP